MRLPDEFQVGNYTKNTAKRLGFIIKVGRIRRQELLCFILALVKCTTIYFFGANSAICFLADSKNCSWITCSVMQLLSVDVP